MATGSEKTTQAVRSESEGAATPYVAWGESVRKLCAHGRGLCILLGACLGFLGAIVAIYHADLALGLLLVLAGCAVVLALASVILSFRSMKIAGDPAAFVDAVRVVAENESGRAAPLQDDNALTRMIDELAIDNQLTPREREVLILLVRGRDVRHISDALYVSVNTVRTHVQNVYTKLGVHSKQELIDFVEARQADTPVSDDEAEVFGTLAMA